MSFCACRNNSSEPALSSIRISLKPEPPLEELDLMLLRVCPSGNEYGTVCEALYSVPVTTGRSGLPSRKPTITSCPTRGRNIPPHCLPAQGCEARIQQDEFSSYFPS